MSNKLARQKFSLFSFSLLFLFLLLTSIALFSFPLLTLAGQSSLNTNNTAYPDMSDPDCQKSTTDPNCLWLYPLSAPKVEPASINLNWEIEGIANSYCRVSCSREDSSSCSGAFGKKDGLFNNSFTSIADFNFKASDQVGTLSSKIGDTYQVACCERRDSPTILNMCKSSSERGISKSSYKVKVVDSQSCEVSWGGTWDGLSKNKIRTITEKDLKGWFSVDDQDGTRFSVLGSGDQTDIKNAIEKIQSCNASVVNDASQINPTAVILTLRERLGKYKPTRLGAMLIDDKNNYLYNHALLALSTSASSNSPAGPFSVNVYDSNLGATADLSCQISAVQINVNGQKINFNSAVSCQSTNSWAAGYSKAILIKGDLYGADIECSENYRARPQPTTWISENINGLDNWASGTNPKGVCLGITDFVTRVACYGDFVGTDYHPNDGKIVGRDCDANHYPLPGATALNSDNSRQLANLGWLDQFIQSLTDWFTKVFENFKLKIGQLY